MSDNANFTSFQDNENIGNFREAVCIDAYRVYDSCADKHSLSYTPTSIISTRSSN